MIEMVLVITAFLVAIGFVGSTVYFVLGAEKVEKPSPVMSRVERSENGVTLTGSSFTGDQIRSLVNEINSFYENEDRPHIKDKWNFMGLEKQENRF